MTWRSKLQSTASAFVAVALVGSATFLLVLLAFRPFNLAGIVNITSPEVWLAAGLAVAAMVVCVWRLARGSSGQEEMAMFAEAASKDDHLG